MLFMGELATCKPQYGICGQSDDKALIQRFLMFLERFSCFRYTFVAFDLVLSLFVLFWDERHETPCI